MSNRRRRARHQAERVRVTREKLLRRSARRARRPSAQTATAATAVAAVTAMFAGVGVPAAADLPVASSGASVVETLVTGTAGSGAPLGRCATPHTPGSDPSGVVDVGGTAFFTANDGIHGEELWKTDGTEAGTVLVKNITPGGNYSSYIRAT